MKVLIIGGGGREHALAWKIKQSPLLKELYCAPGNPGTKELGVNLNFSDKSLGALALWALENEIDLTVVGPEAPLAEGIVDIFQEHGLRIFGPTRAAAQLEWSKAFAKEIMLRAGVATAAAEVFHDYQSARRYILERGAPIVIKADGLATGKGVVVAQSVEEALEGLERCMLDQAFGAAGNKVVIEDFIDGREASLMVMVDGATSIPLLVSQDYKRVFDNDQGPNTGGMGAISPTPVLDDHRVENLVGEIFHPVVRELASRGVKYVGFLYAGVIVERSTGNIKVLEFNCRLGDPETQVLMMRLKSDLLKALDAAVRGKLSSIELKWRKEAACCVVAASAGYPGDVDDGHEIRGLFPDKSDLVVFQAGTVEDPEDAAKVRSKGGRVLGITALGETTQAAVSRAYEGISRVDFKGKHYRKDIGR